MKLPPLVASPGRPYRHATRLAFFVAGLGGASLAPMVPIIRQRVALSDGGLGLLLLCLGLGSIGAMMPAGAVAARHGCRCALLAAIVPVCLALPVLAVATWPPMLALALLAFGAGLGAFDCVMNIQAVIVERAAGRPMMSGFHGLFSVGGIVGAAGMSALLAAGATPLAAILGVLAVIVAALAVAAPGFPTRAGAAEPTSDDGPGGGLAARPRGTVPLIGALCFVCFLAEGSALDWSGVFLTTVRHLPVAWGGLGYAGFAAAMTLGRLTGDPVVARFGGRRVVGAGALCAACGLGLATLVPAVSASLAGYALLGAGCANIVPALYSAAGRAAIPAITTMGYAGILAGPAAIGAAAAAAGLPAALLGVAACLLAVAAAARLIPGR